jgi:hypothetical protein
MNLDPSRETTLQGVPFLKADGGTAMTAMAERLFTIRDVVHTVEEGLPSESTRADLDEEGSHYVETNGRDDISINDSAVTVQGDLQAPLPSRCGKYARFFFTNYQAWAIHWLVLCQLGLYHAHYNDSLREQLGWLTVNCSILAFLGVTYMYQRSLQRLCRLLSFYEGPSRLILLCRTYSLLVPELMLNLSVLTVCTRRPRAAFVILAVSTAILMTVSLLGFLARFFNQYIIPEHHRG